MTIVPRTLTGRTILVLLTGLVVSYLVGLLIYAGERDTALTSVAGVTVAERIAAVAQAMERTPPAARAGLVCAQSGSGFAVTLASQAAVESGQGGWWSRLLRSTIRDSLGDPAPERLRVANSRFHDDASRKALVDVIERCMGPMMRTMPGMMGGRDRPGMTMTPAMQRMMQPRRSGEILRVSYRLDDGRWLNFTTLAPRFDSIWRSRFLLAFSVMALVVTVLSVWAVRRSTAPLALFAWAAERLGRDVNAPDLPEDGPREVHRAAKAFNEMQRRLRSMISDRTQMLAAISHDLRTPITRLRLRAEFVDDGEQRAKMLNDLEEMEAMIVATLAFAREDSTDEPRKTLDLAVLVQSACDDAVDVGREVVYTGTARAAYSGRPLALKRVLANLIDNAVRYGGRARVALEVTPERFVITVEDDGPGIPDSELERVFEPFYRLEASRSRDTGGTGLGLAVVRSIVRGHGGEVVLANRAEGGLRAIVMLPLAPGE
ncbi:MAG: ATP-binding protein [Gammaproteobacteria bacterium]|nr:MAG: ATP-binding protein [Gammaproteobacteria bacterium]